MALSQEIANGSIIPQGLSSYVAICLTVISLLYWRSTQSKGKSFPGPPSIPVLGSLPWIGTQQFPELVQREWSVKYGPIFQVDFGMRRMVIIADEPMAREVLNKNSGALGARPKLFYYQDELGLDHSFVPMCASSNPIVEPCRRLNMKVVRMAGLKGAMHSSSSLTEYLADPSHGHNTDPHQLALIFSCLTMLNLSHGLQLTPEKFMSHRQINDLLKSIAGIMSMVSFDADRAAQFPILRLLRPFHTRKMIKRAIDTREKFLQACKASEVAVLQDVKEAGGFDNWPDCTLKFALSGNASMDVEHATTQAAITLGAGTHTMTLTTTALLGALAYDQVQQQKLREDVAARDSPLGAGPEELPPRAMAFIRTLLRKYPPVPSNTPRQTTAEIVVGDIVIPKDTTLFPIIESINNMSPFDVENELREGEKRADAGDPGSSGHWAFGFGRRACPAGAFAERQIAYFCAHLVSKFYITFEDKERKYANIDEALKYHYFGLNRVAGVAKLHFEPIPS